MEYTLDQLPLQGELFIAWGGNTPEVNQHHRNLQQRYAIDFLMIDEEGRAFKNDGFENDDYYIYDEAVYPAGEGTVVMAVDGITDNQIGSMHKYFVPGNTVVVQHDKNVFAIYAHLSCGSVRVEKGDTVTPETTLGLCGNSGNSSEPHLHFHLQDSPIAFNEGKPLKPIIRKVQLNGTTSTDHTLIKDEIVSNVPV